MARNIHVHIHRPTTDNAGWNESLHPRKDDGKFGSGGGGAAKALPAYPSMKDVGGEGNYKLMEQALRSSNKASAISDVLSATKNDKSEGTKKMRAYLIAVAEHKGLKISGHEPAAQSEHSLKAMKSNGRKTPNATAQEKADYETAERAKRAKLRSKPGYVRLPGEVD